MLCSKCGNNTQCKTAKVYYAEIINVKSSMHDTLLTSQTTTTTTYRKPRDRDISICLDCIIKRKRRNLLLTPLYVLIVIAIFGAIVEADEILLNVLGGVWLFVVVVVITILVRKRYKTKISDIDVYTMARGQLKKQLKASSRKIQYAFWPKYPSHLKTVK